MLLTDSVKPQLKEPFPSTDEFWKDPKTGLWVPRDKDANIAWREQLLNEATNDVTMQADLMAACNESLAFWVNAFGWTYHQFDVDPETGKRYEAVEPYVPMITWDIQLDLFDNFIVCLKKAEDILVSKTRDMGASWCCVFFMHWMVAGVFFCFLLIFFL